MNKISPIIRSFIFLLLSLCTVGEVTAYHPLPPCYRELEENFFNPNTVVKALSLHDVYQSQWDLIVQDLQKRSKEVHKIVDQRAMRLHPDPLNRPIDTQRAEELLMSVLFEIFVSVLGQHGVSNEGDLREMFQYIRRAEKERVEACFGKKQPILRT